MIKKAAFVLLVIVLLFSCRKKEQTVSFPVRGTDAALYGLGRVSAEAYIDFAKPEKIEYRFDDDFFVQPPASLEISYSFTMPPATWVKESWQLVLEAGDASWALPMDISFMGMETAGGKTVFHYAIPIAGSFAGRFSLALLPMDMGTKKIKGGELPRFTIHSLEVKERWFGFSVKTDGAEKNFFVSPFVFNRQGEFVIEVPPVYSTAGNSRFLPELAVELEPGRDAALAAGQMHFSASPFLRRLAIPAGIIASNAGPLILSGDRVSSFYLRYAIPPSFPLPIAADPGMLIAWPQSHWRDSRFELFRWKQFPSLLIFDFADYAGQDRMLKRLAFFVEKAGFRGRLASDAEIAGLHAWNAHDYRALDLARFFEAARASNFPLLEEERELEQILFNEAIIRRSANGQVQAGEGGVISVSRESADYLRSLFMVHEAFHGLFFIDDDFREFSRRRWENLPIGARRFITSYFDFQHYDIKDEYLMVNEFMAHVLQQPVSQAAKYFGETLASRIESSSWRRSVLPEKDEASGSWPVLAEIFTKEAEAFSSYVASRWGLAAGRVRLVTVQGF